MTCRYLDLDLPETFILEIRSEAGAWIEWGAYQAEDFERLEDGGYVYEGHGGSPTWLRCVGRRGDYFEHVDGGGTRTGSWRWKSAISSWAPAYISEATEGPPADFSASPKVPIAGGR